MRVGINIYGCKTTVSLDNLNNFKNAVHNFLRRQYDAEIIVFLVIFLQLRERNYN
jgi:hypothetical protein